MGEIVADTHNIVCQCDAISFRSEYSKCYIERPQMICVLPSECSAFKSTLVSGYLLLSLFLSVFFHFLSNYNHDTNDKSPGPFENILGLDLHRCVCVCVCESISRI